MGSMSKFELGQIVATPGALDAFKASGEEPFPYLQRHDSGDWGEELDPSDRAENEFALRNRLRLLSEYRVKNGTVIWIITEADRSSTCVLTPSEY